ncbi:MAG TPA: acetyl-CoA carboxylase carboxyltransferase subunit alpha [Bdellovibrionota bacterium]|nr:acetyl-CoA carboxylase carboxyltransferase subunit alpha [Bdellovibrionota bacterium]
MKLFLDFEKPIVELERKISELQEFSKEENVDIMEEVRKLQKKTKKLVDDIFSKLTPWQRTQLSRHAERPYMLDYVDALFTDFTELFGDRNYADDPSIIGGVARFNGESVMVIGHQKGRSTKEKIRRNFGMPRPEGYRKALRLMSMAERFRIPIVTFIDTPGAYPGIGAEERGQAEAIAKNILVMSVLKVPIISIVIGEGGSGGALAIGVADRILMLEYSIYSVISPESCAAILWRDSAKAELAAKALRLTAPEMLTLGIADELLPEPEGGAHRNFQGAAGELRAALARHLDQLKKLSPEELVQERYKKFRKMGSFSNGSAGAPIYA